MYNVPFAGLAALFLVITSSCATAPSSPSPKDPNQVSLLNQGNQFARDGLLREAVDAYKKAFHGARLIVLNFERFFITKDRLGVFII